MTHSCSGSPDPSSRLTRTGRGQCRPAREPSSTTSHRKAVPTGGERLVWAQGDGSTLDVYDTPIGKIGGLICWENYMPLARYALYAWGIHLYVAATWDRGQPWLSTLRHVAKEGRVYVISSGMALRKTDIPDHFEVKQRFYSHAGEWINVGD